MERLWIGLELLIWLYDDSFDVSYNLCYLFIYLSILIVNSGILLPSIISVCMVVVADTIRFIYHLCPGTYKCS